MSGILEVLVGKVQGTVIMEYWTAVVDEEKCDKCVEVLER